MFPPPRLPACSGSVCSAGVAVPRLPEAPEEVAGHLATFLGPEALLILAQVSRALRRRHRGAVLRVHARSLGATLRWANAPVERVADNVVRLYLEVLPPLWSPSPAGREEQDDPSYPPPQENERRH